MNEIIELLKLSPGVSITLGFIFAAFIAWLFRDLIVLYVKKKYELYDVSEIKHSVNKVITDTELLADRNEPIVINDKILDVSLKVAKNLRDRRNERNI